jgi:hypothetical protein
MSILDIAPTLLAMQNLPISTELPGRVFEDVLRDDFLESAPIERVESYAVRPVTIDDQQADIESEQDSMRTLRALGYVGGDTELAVEDLPSDSGFWEIDVHLRRRALAGEIVYHLLNDDIENVRRVVRLVSENDPDLVGQLATSTQGEIKRLERSLGQLPFSPATLDRAQNLFTRLASSPLGKLSTDDGSGSRAEIAVD